MAGIVQIIAGLAGAGQIFRAVSPTVIYGMLSGIGVLIFASQFHVMFDDTPKADGLMNLLSIPEAIANVVLLIGSASAGAAALLISLVTLCLIVVWERMKPANLKLVPEL